MVESKLHAAVVHAAALPGGQGRDMTVCAMG